MIPANPDRQHIPVLWINLNRKPRRRARMEWAIAQEGWQAHRQSGWVLLMEDDVDTSLAAPLSWAHSLAELIDRCPAETLAFQMTPISAEARQTLFGCWRGNWHPLVHPWCIRPVTDKWLYGGLPPGSCRVATYPHFCLEAQESSLHQHHMQAFHRPSRAAPSNSGKAMAE